MVCWLFTNFVQVLIILTENVLKRIFSGKVSNSIFGLFLDLLGSLLG